MQLKHTKKIYAVYREGVVTDQMWFVKFCAGSFSLGDASWLPRPVKVDSN